MSHNAVSPAAPFQSFHRHGFARVGAATPAIVLADPQANAAAILELAVAASDKAADLLVFPELGLTGYSIDDLHLQDSLLDAAEHSLLWLARESAQLSPVLLVGVPLRRNNRVYNCAAVLSRGAILGVVPKSFLPNYREYYEKRWFAPGIGLSGLTIDLGGKDVPFGPDLLFAAQDLRDFVFHAEICEDFWAPNPPSTTAALAGALVLCNLSASNVTVGKSRERHLLAASQSMRCVAAYVYAAAGPGESTNDVAWDGQGMVHELGELLAESARFATSAQMVLTDVDLTRIRQERMRTGTFNDAATAAAHPEARFRRVEFSHQPDWSDRGLMRALRRFPYVPNSAKLLDEDCYEAFNIQVHGLIRRFEATPGDTMVLGISGGLDSTHALIVAAKACDVLGLPRRQILGFTMPGFATSDETRDNAWRLMRAVGVTADEIDIKPAARQMLADMGHPFANGQPVYDVTFENVQAGLRTDYLFRLANQRNGFVIGTGDLSEIALGWSTYGVGDHMSHYNVNPGVPKTLIQHLIRWCVATKQFDDATGEILTAILATEISPELVPADAEGKIQSTQDRIGPYELHDFFLYHIMRHGQSPAKVAYLALNAWQDAARGEWPPNFPEAARHSYTLPQIARWLEVFLFRFFQTSQFKRTAMPNGPKVSSGGALSPRGDWRAPSDAVANSWLVQLRAALKGELVED
ncbi:NAD(+) synthase [Aureimonas fodinaquatilis]|uniref:NAD(+) synthase n=1 Tax=Aureimonas fodinaquatilis TaxID=2565783 RepID=UPI001FE32468|nr:NAD(+) synthase [Aureimonas fodinaquatilis]